VRTTAVSGWDARLAADAARAARNQNAEQAALTAELLRRGRAAGIEALALTGSTARRRRTAISDLDYHVIGPRLEIGDLPGELDVVTDSAASFAARIAGGDDFAQWTVRFGCVLLDEAGTMRAGWEAVERDDLWPDADEKLRHAAPLADLAEKVIGIEDPGAGQEHVRAALTALARGLLLRARVFPLARAELGGQLGAIGEPALGAALDRTIHASLDLDELGLALDLVRGALSTAR
jgi:hypothetical protein